MSAATEPTTMLRERRDHRAAHARLAPGATVVKWMTTTDHKVIGNLYFITSFVVVPPGRRSWRSSSAPS